MGHQQGRGRTAPTRRARRVELSAPLPEPTNRYLNWRFGRLDHDGRFSCRTLARLTEEELKILERHLLTFQATPIWELEKEHVLKFIGTRDMTPAGRERLAVVSPQENGLWQLRVPHDKWRIWGYFENPDFTFLWWDGLHEVAVGRSRSTPKN
jgi:hypothetical protein